MKKTCAINFIKIKTLKGYEKKSYHKMLKEFSKTNLL